MTSQLEKIASILDLEKVKTCLFSPESTDHSDDFADESWNWSVEETITSKENWLEECEVSLSPTSELLVFAHRKNLVILSAKWDTDEEGRDHTKYSLSWQGSLSLEQSEIVTSILCLPICAQGKLSAHCGADWTCIAVGFSSGAVRFYTEKGSLLHSEVLHEGPVIRLKCQSFQPFFSSVFGLPSDELFIMYSDVIVCIQGFVLCNTIKACRNQLARVEAKCGEPLNAPPLALMKWGLSEQESILDISILGSHAMNGFSQLSTASIRGGYEASVRNSPPQIFVAIATGVRPYVGFHAIVEGTTNPVLSDVAKAVASKFKFAIGQVVPGWLGGGRSAVERKEKVIEPAEAMNCRFGLCDAIRKGERIVISPEKSLSVACDSLGRVNLIDNLSGIAIRMWKGYRDARCGFIPVEETKPGRGRRGLFLVIYAPKKGIIEVWALQQGPKIATFVTSKNGRFLYIDYGLLGVNSVSMLPSNTSYHPCVFINSSGVISNVTVPFHSILSKSDPKSRDEHIFKQIKKTLSNCQASEFLQFAAQLTTSKVKIQVLEAAAKAKFMSLDVFSSLLVEFLEKLKSIEEDKLNVEDKMCRLTCENYQKLLNFYLVTVALLAQPPQYSTVVADSPVDDDEDLAKALRLTKDDTQRIFSFITASSEKSSSRSKVKFELPDTKLSLFLTSFWPSVTKSPPLTINQNMKSYDLATIGQVLCQCVLYGSCSLDSWKKDAADSCIEGSSLLHCAICYWLEKPLGSNARSEVILFMNLLAAIASQASQRESVEFWEGVRSVITETKNITNALTAAIIARSVYLNLEDQLSDINDSDWVAVSNESYIWSQLISQAEAVAILESTLNCEPPATLRSPHMPRLEYCKPNFSLSDILQKGPGSVCESVAKWVSSWGLKPEWLSVSIETASGRTDTEETVGIDPGCDPSNEARETLPAQDSALQLLNDLRHHFPYTLAPGPLVAAQSWEYVSIWAKATDHLELFRVSLRCFNHIESPHLRQGLYSIIWSVHLKPKFESIALLLHKAGKLPDNQDCVNYINMSSKTVKPFLDELFTFYVEFVRSHYLAVESTEMTKIKVEPMWSECQPSLAEICLAQAPPNPFILELQVGCVSVLALMAGLGITLRHPITLLFDKTTEKIFWRDIKDLSPIVIPTPDSSLQTNRSNFIQKVITAAVEPLNNGGGNLTETVATVGLAFRLAEAWKLDIDTLRIHQVIHFYLANRDAYAAEGVMAVSDKERLCRQLITIVGRRLKTLLICRSGEESEEGISLLSTSHLSWIQEQEPVKPGCTIKRTIQLLELIQMLIPDSTPLGEFAGRLHFSIKHLDKIEDI